MSEVDKLKAKIAELERRMGVGEDNPMKDGYVVMVGILRQQNTYLKDFKIKETITSEEKGKSNEYERAKGLWEKLPGLIQSVNALKIELKMEGEDKPINYERPITASNIADQEDDD